LLCSALCITELPAVWWNKCPACERMGKRKHLVWMHLYLCTSQIPVHHFPSIILTPTIQVNDFDFHLG
jgi:hypothetical protein